MSYQPVSGIVPQYSNDSNELASGYYLKFYIANTTTPLSMATDSGGGTLLVKCKLNPDGLPISNPLDNDTVFVPHVSQSYRLVIYRDEDDANADNTAAAFLNVPSLEPLAPGSVSGGVIPYVFDSRDDEALGGQASNLLEAELATGDYAQTAGKVTPGDGEGQLYEIVDSGGDVTLDNGKEAKIVSKHNTATGTQTVAGAFNLRRAEYSTLAALETAGDNGDLTIDKVYGTETYANGNFHGANTYKLIDGGASRPAQDSGSIRHISGGSGFLYLEGQFPNGVWIEQFGATGDGSTFDDTARSDALTYSPVVRLQPGLTYRFNPFQIDSSRLLWGHDTQILMDNHTGAGVTINPAAGGRYQTVLKGLRFRGGPNSFEDDSALGTPELPGRHGMLLQAPYVTIEDVSFSNFDRTHYFGDNAYIFNWRGGACNSSNYGVWGDLTGVSDAGERLAYHDVTFSENIWNGTSNKANLWFDHCSLDYPVTGHWEDNITDVSGAASAVVTFNVCHFETTSTDTPTAQPRFTNNGRMVFKGGAIWDSNDAALQLFSGTGETYGIGTALRIGGSSGAYLAGAAGVRVSWSLPVSMGFNDAHRLTRSNSKFVNNGFETGDLTGWFVGGAGNAVVDNADAKQGTYSVKLTSNGTQSDDLNSSMVSIPPNASRVIVSGWRKMAGSATTAKARSVFKSRDDTGALSNILVQDFGSTGSADADWVYVYDEIEIPAGADSYVLVLTISIGSESCRFDEFYIEFF